MKRYLVAGLLLVPLFATSAYAGAADKWVNNYADDDARSAYDMSQNTSVSTGSEPGGNGNQTAVVTHRQTGPTFTQDNDSNDTNDVGGSSLIPIVGNDILNNTDVANNLLNNYSQTDSSSNPITQSRSEDNHTSTVIGDSFNTGQKTPVLVLDSRPARVHTISESSVGRLPTTGFNLLSPLALGLWLLSAGFWMVRMGKSPGALKLRLSS